jgi:phage terminase small subunit
VAPERAYVLSSNVSDIPSKRRQKWAAKHLKPATRRWFDQIRADYELESHHEMLLLLAAEAWDRHLDARQTLKEHGTSFTNKHWDIKPHPAILIERDSRNAFIRAVRELNLSEEGPAEAARPPRLRYGGR